MNDHKSNEARRTQDQVSSTSQTQSQVGTIQQPDDPGFARWRAMAEKMTGDQLLDFLGFTLPRGFDPALALQTKAWHSFLKDIGARYTQARLENFVITEETQRKAMALVRAYLHDIDAQMESGNGLVFYGPVGTGKDHLAIAAGREAICAGYTVCWRSAQKIFSDFRDSFSDDSGENEADLLRSLLLPEILIVSDSVPSHGGLTEFQGNVLYRIVNARYSELKPTWATLNVIDIAEAQRRVGMAAIDRLTHGATAVSCYWPSHRQASVSG